MNHIINKDENNQRLDIILSALLDISRSQVQRIIKDDAVLVNTEVIKKNYRAQEGDTITIKESYLNELQKPKELLPNKKIKLDVLFEDEYILVINKPAGTLVHPTERYEPDTIVNGLLARYPDIKDVGENPMRPGIVHRIDKMVSGVLVIAKTQESFTYFKNLFKSRRVYKEYIALVHGKMEKKWDIIHLSLERHRESGKMVARPQSQEQGKEAITEYDVIRDFEHFSLLKVIIKTGRTHQIRAHLNALNHPIVGDPLYKQKKVKAHIELDRIFLHAKKLEFKHITGEELSFELPLPKELETILKNLS